MNTYWLDSYLNNDNHFAYAVDVVRNRKLFSFNWHHILAEIKCRGGGYHYIIKLLPYTTDKYVMVSKLNCPVQGKVTTLKEAKEIIERYYNEISHNK